MKEGVPYAAGNGQSLREGVARAVAQRFEPHGAKASLNDVRDQMSNRKYSQGVACDDVDFILYYI